MHVLFTFKRSLRSLFVILVFKVLALSICWLTARRNSTNLWFLSGSIVTVPFWRCGFLVMAATVLDMYPQNISDWNN